MWPLARRLLCGEVRCGESGSMNTLTPTQETEHSHHPREFTDSCLHSPEKAMAPHSSTLAWKIPWMEEPGSCGRTELDTTEVT